MDAIEAAQRSASRRAAVIHLQMRRGLSSLATIASVAPLIGLFATVCGIVSSFHGGIGEKAAAMAALAQRLSESIAPVALSLLVAIPALWCYRYLTIETEAFDREMQIAIIDLTDSLSFILDE